MNIGKNLWKNIFQKSLPKKQPEHSTDTAVLYNPFVCGCDKLPGWHAHWEDGGLYYKNVHIANDR